MKDKFAWGADDARVTPRVHHADGEQAMREAAPELLEALELAHKLLVGVLTDNQLDFVHATGDTVRGKIAVIEDTIAKAKGRAA